MATPSSPPWRLTHLQSWVYSDTLRQHDATYVWLPHTETNPLCGESGASRTTILDERVTCTACRQAIKLAIGAQAVAEQFPKW